MNHLIQVLQQFLHNAAYVEVAIYVIKILVIFGAVLGSVPFMVLLERILIARIQQRVGPNRVGLPGTKNIFILGGILQTIVDGIKLFLKEDVRPASVDRVLHTLAPLITLVPAIFVLAIVPVGPAIGFSFFGNAYTINLGITDLPIGILFYMAVTGVAVYGIVLAGWSSNNKYSLLGGLRSTAQMLSYEIAMGLSFAGVLLIAGTFDLRRLIADQGSTFYTWYAIKQPVGFLLFLVAGFAETNRLPFDLPEGESELGGGFHTEYSSMKFAMFFMSEYMNMFTFAAILTTLFLGGFQAPLPALNPFADLSLLHGIVGIVWFSLKVFLIICFMIFIRGTLPRFRYDQLMDLGWKLMFPAALVNLLVTAGVVALAPRSLTTVLFIAGAAQIVIIDRLLTARRKRVLHVS